MRAEKITLWITIGLLCFQSAFSQKQMPADDAILFKAGNENVTVGEFRYVYEKNNLQNDSLYLKPDLDTYLNLYIHFKLKVMEAKAMGMDTIPAFIQEFETYRKQLARPYLTETKVSEDLIKEAYERMLYQIDASHILIQIKDASDTLEAYHLINEIKRRAMQGENFETLARQYSQDPSASQNGGRLGYFSAFQMVYPFESAAFKTNVNNISEIIKTRFGYHILKVHDKRPNPGQVQVAHIYLRQGNDPSAEAVIEKKARQIFEKLSSGDSWDAICLQFSEDQRTKNQGGVLPFFGTGEMPQPFEDAAMQLTSPGEISQPFNTQYGWHILKLISKKPVDTFENLRETLVQQVSRDTRAQQGKRHSIENLKKEYGFRVDENLKNLFRNLADTTLSEGKWQWNSQSDNKLEIFMRIGDQTLSAYDFATFIEKNQRKRAGLSPQQYFDNLYERFEEETILSYEEKMLEVNHKDYKYLIQEYKNGLLLFDVMEKMVWGKSMADTTGLKQFYEDHKNNYRWNTRARARIFHAAEPEIIDEIEEKLKLGDEINLIDLKIDGYKIDDLGSVIDTLISLRQKVDDISLIIAGNVHSSESIRYLQQKIDSLRLYDVVFEVSLDENNKNSLSVSGKSKSIKAFEHFYNRTSALTLHASEGVYEKEVSEWPGHAPWQEGLYRFIENDRYYLVIVDTIEPPTNKRLNEARGRVISDYQQFLENRWLKELKQKYTVKINKRTVSKMYKKI
ncbi:MAG: peptidylprolyl isomerase [Cyclobacteriaceae bacterium]|nr:peptidylprolyl isomerase [Cyclobacteriaceae bacterium]